jgi:hypothetical protein
MRGLAGATTVNQTLTRGLQHWAAVLALALIGAVLTSADGPASLAAAREASDRLDLVQAMRLAQGVLGQGEARADETLEIHRFLAELAASMGQNELAVREFGIALELDPTIRLGADASPRIRLPFDAASRDVGPGLSADVRTERRGSGRFETTVRVSGDRLKLVQRATVLSTGGSFPVGTEGKVRIWSCTEPCPWRVALLDAAGNQLWLSGEHDGAPPAQASDAAAAPAESLPSVDERPALHRPLPWVVLAAVFAVAAVASGIAFGIQQGRVQSMLANKGDWLLSEAQSAEALREAELGCMISSAVLAAGSSLGVAFTW